MIIFAATTSKLQALLAGAVTTNQLPINSTWADENYYSGILTAGATQTTTNDTSTVNAVPGPASSTYRHIRTSAIYNRDTVAATLSVFYNDGSTNYTMFKQALAVGDTLAYTEPQRTIWLLNTAAYKLEVLLGGAITTNQLHVVSVYDTINNQGNVTPSLTATTTNNTTAVTIVAAIAGSQVARLVKLVNIYNADTVSQTLTLRFNANGTTYIIGSWTLVVGQTLTFNEPEVWRVTNSSGATVPESALYLSDNTTADVSITKHGLAPKLPNDATKFLDGSGAYSVPTGGMTNAQVLVRASMRG